MTDTPAEKEKVSFEKVFDLIGGNGRFQWRLAWIINLQLIFLTWNHLGYIFIGAVPNHWCETPILSSQTNWTNEEIKQFSIPTLNDISEGQKLRYDSCSYFEYDYSNIAEKFSNDFNGALQYVKDSVNDTRKRACDAWIYDDSIYRSTIVTEFDLVCHRRYLAATIQSTYMIGGFIGTFIFGTLNDRVLGRRNSALLSIILVILGGFAASLANSYLFFVILRMFVAVGTAGCMQACSLLRKKPGALLAPHRLIQSAE